MLALKGRSAADEVSSAASVLQRRGLRAEVLNIQAAQGVEATTVVRVMVD